MAKGRKFVPAPDREGIWFSHRGADNSSAGTSRKDVTSTGQMLSAPFSDTGTLRPPRPPPVPFDVKAQTIYRATNPFSSHDNRNTIQDRGEYFGDGKVTRSLGRKLLQPLHNREHHTDTDFLMHHCRQPTLYSYDTEFATLYTGAPTDDPPTRHRFPRLRTEPHSGLLRPLPTTLTDWQPITPRSLGSVKASNQVLAMSQKPYLKHDSWKYSYHGLPKIYPPYSLIPATKFPATDNVLNRYGADFPCSTQTKM